jgi:transposase-like protein
MAKKNRRPASERVAKVMQLIKDGARVGDACRQVGLAPSILYAHRKAQPSLSQPVRTYRKKKKVIHRSVALPDFSAGSDEVTLKGTPAALTRLLRGLGAGGAA